MSGMVVPVEYRPHDTVYRLDLEVIDAEELRARVALHPQRGFERVDFQCFLFVRSGTYFHTVDFETHRCTAGSCLSIGPGQVHRFGPPTDWDGWILIIESHHVPEMVELLPTHVRTDIGLAAAISELFERMTADTALSADPAPLGELLALQARVLVSRLTLGEAAPDAERSIDPIVLQRYREYRVAVDREYRRWHLVASYAGLLGYSTKSLNRACQAASNVTAKRVIIDRIILEAKRLLAHSEKTAARISVELGFDEPTNFAKFFRRETDLTPAAFRAAIREH